MGTIIEATYSPEDNKLRLYTDGRLSHDDYLKVKEAGFVWAPKQELFVAPAWTPQREDFCLEWVHQIEPEGMTVAERAEAKIERLDTLAEKRARESSAYHKAAQSIAARFSAGQPILVGHHSQRRAEKDRERMDASMRKAVSAMDAANYWQGRAAGVERHVNHKTSARVRANRIQRLLKELRDHQRKLNHAYLALELWKKIKSKSGEDDFNGFVEDFSGYPMRHGPAAPFGLWGKIKDGEVSHAEAVELCLQHWERCFNSVTRYRWIEHTLNRLAYERSELGPVPLYEGELSPTILQAFARSQGADQPKVSHAEGRFTLKSFAPLPLHVGEGETLTLSDEEWKTLMRDCGYEVPTPKPKKPALLNFKAQTLTGTKYGNTIHYPVIELTKADYSAIYTDYKGTCLSACGGFRFRTAMWKGGLVAVYLTDSKTHPIPESEAVVRDQAQGAA